MTEIIFVPKPGKELTNIAPYRTIILLTFIYISWNIWKFTILNLKSYVAAVWGIHGIQFE